MTRLVLGVDGGGTKTLAAIFDEQGALLGMGTGGPSNFDDLGIEAAQANLGRAVEAARQAAGMEARPFEAAFFGMAGVVSETDRSVIRRMSDALNLTACAGIDHDIRTALAGGLSGRPGIALIVGTGSSCYGRNAAGEDWRSGGWGHLINDEGSSYWYGVQAMRYAVSAYDGRGEPTLLLDAVRARFGLHDMNDLMHRIYVPPITRAEAASLAPLVMDAARQGDRVALHLIKVGSAELAACVAAVAARLGMADGLCELALIGGLLNAGEVVRAPLETAVRRHLPNCRITLAELPPVFGAGLLALELLHLSASAPHLDALKAAAARL